MSKATTSGSVSQLALPLQLEDHAVFASFYALGNEPLVAALETAAAGQAPGCWLWGGQAVGKTHLLQAVCASAGDESAYVPLARFAAAGAGLIAGLESRRVVCIDDVDKVAGDEAWESALFTLYNDLLASDGVLVLAASMPPRQCAFDLADLSSRLTQLPVFQVHALADSDRAAALQLRAKLRGMTLPTNVATYLLNRSRRDMASLYDLLDTLDRESLRAKKRLSMSFVREVLQSKLRAESASS